MKDTADFEGIGDVNKEKPIVGYLKTKFVASLKRFHIALAGAGKTVQRGKNSHSCLAVNAPNIRLRRFLGVELSFDLGMRHRNHAPRKIRERIKIARCILGGRNGDRR